MSNGLFDDKKRNAGRRGIDRLVPVDAGPVSATDTKFVDSSLDIPAVDTMFDKEEWVKENRS